MITNAIYSHNNIVYKDDKIISFPPKYTSKENILIVHNDLKYQNDHHNLNTYIAYNYSIYYTSDLNVKEKNFKHVKNDSSYDLNNLNNFISSICFDDNILYSITLFSFEQYNNFNFNSNIAFQNYKVNMNINFDNKIEIIDSNIKNIIGHVFSVDEIIYIYSIGTINFNNYIMYKYDDYDICVKVDLIYSNNSDINLQMKAILNTYKYFKIENRQKFKQLINIYNHSYNYIIDNSDNITNIKFDKILLKTLIDNIKDKYLNDILCEDNTSEKLFKQYLRLNNNNIIISLSNKYYINNIAKIRERQENTIVNIDNNKKLNESLEYYTSPITLNNWQDEIEENLCLGLLINVKCSKLCKLGFLSTDIHINNYTNTLLSINEIIGGHENFISKYKVFDNGKYDKNAFMGSNIGKGNAMLPIYINDIHWSYAKNYIEECVSLAICQNSFSFKPIMLDIYIQTLMNVINVIMENDFSYNDFITFVNLYITVKKITKNTMTYKYFLSDKFISEQNSIECHNINKILIDYLIFKNNDDNDNIFFHKIYEENIRRTINNFHKGKLKYFLNFDNNKEMILKNLSDTNINIIYKLNQMQNILKTIVNIFHDCNGIIEYDMYEKFKSNIKNCKNFNYLNNVLNNNNLIKPDNNNSINDAIIDHLLLQSFITRNNKKKIKAVKNNKYQDILLCQNSDIIKNNKIIKKIIH